MAVSHGPVPWDELSESAMTGVIWLVYKLRDKHVGRLTLHANQGGVTGVTVERVVSRNDDGSRHIRVRTFQTDEISAEVERLATANGGG
jgi:hypothetical protein